MHGRPLSRCVIQWKGASVDAAKIDGDSFACMIPLKRQKRPPKLSRWRCVVGLRSAFCRFMRRHGVFLMLPLRRAIISGNSDSGNLSIRAFGTERQPFRLHQIPKRRSRTPQTSPPEEVSNGSALPLPIEIHRLWVDKVSSIHFEKNLER